MEDGSATRWCPWVPVEVVGAFQNFIGRFCGVNAGGAKHVEGVLCLWEEFVPQLGREISISGAEPGDEVVLEGLDGSLCGIDSVLVRGYKLPFDVLLAEVFGDGVGCFIVKDVEVWFETFGGKVGEDVVECLDDGGGFTVRNGSDNDGIGGIVIGHEDVLLVLQ